MVEFLKFWKKVLKDEPKETPAPVAREIYRFKQNEDPFRDIVHVKVLAVSGKFLQYSFCDSCGNINPYSPKWSNDIETFNYCYKKVE